MPNIIIHGHAKKRQHTRTYRSWCNMLTRCHNPSNKAFQNYGKRGIVVCEKWRHSFVNFLADAGECPDGLTLDRIHNDVGYEPGNIRWVSRAVQAANRRNNTIVTVRGITGPLTNVIRHFGLSYYFTIRRRVLSGWGHEEAFFTPPRPNHRYNPRP